MAAPTIGVCGFGRCGSTMAMAMLRAGGLEPVDGSDRVSGEVPDLTFLWRRGPGYFAGRSVKLLDCINYYGLPAAEEWRFLWMDRNPAEQARSQVKLAEQGIGMALTDAAVERFIASYQTDRPKALGALRRRGPVLVLRYENVLADPRKAAKKMRALFPGLDIHAAAAAVHDRDGKCRPDLAFEESS